MNYLNLYKSRLHSTGSNQSDGLVHASKQTVANSFSNTLFSEFVLINDVSTEVVLTNGKKSEDKTMLLQSNTKIEEGSIVQLTELFYLVVDFQGDGINEVYPTATLKQCNSHFPIQSPPTKTFIAYDHLNRPVYEEVAGEVELIPCITEKKLFAFGVDQAINIPDNQIMVTIPYRQHENIKIGKQFTVDEEIYEIRDVDKTKVFNNVGLLVITGERRGDE